MTTTTTREQAIDAAGAALAAVAKELRQKRRVEARRTTPKPQPQAEQQSDAA